MYASGLKEFISIRQAVPVNSPPAEIHVAPSLSCLYSSAPDRRHAPVLSPQRNRQLVIRVSLALFLLSSCTQYRHYTRTDPPVSQAGAPPAQPLPLRYRLTDFEVDAESGTSGMTVAFGAMGVRIVQWRDEAPEDLRRAYLELYRSQAWIGSETKHDRDADFRIAARVDVTEKNTIWVPGVLLYTLAAATGLAAGTFIGIAVDDSPLGVEGLLTGAFGGLIIGSVAGSFIPNYRAAVEVTARTRMESTARRGGVGGTFYEKTCETSRTELYTGWDSGEDGRSDFIGEVVQENQRVILTHLRVAGPGMLRALVNTSTETATATTTTVGVVRVFVSDVDLDLEGMEDLGPVLASEIQVALQETGRFQALTLENLEAQLRKEKKKALLSCSDDGCIQRIVENFGIPDTVFGRVKTLGTGRVHLALTWTRDGDVLHAVTALSEGKPGALIEDIRGLVEKLAAAVSSMDDEQ